MYIRMRMYVCTGRGGEIYTVHVVRVTREKWLFFNPTL